MGKYPYVICHILRKETGRYGVLEECSELTRCAHISVHLADKS